MLSLWSGVEVTKKQGPEQPVSTGTHHDVSHSLCGLDLYRGEERRTGDVKYAKEGHITEEVKYLGGVVGGGLMVLMPALYIQLTGQTGCCGNRLGMLVSIIFAGVGAVGAAYCFIVALIGLHNGPLCNDGDKWTRPFADRDPNYMTKSSWWTECLEPKNVVQFNMGLFITLMAASCLQVVLCVIQVINGLVGCLCGTGNEK